MSAFESMKTEGGETERIQSYVTCVVHATSTSRLLCDCQQGFPLTRTKKCSNCGPSRCQGCIGHDDNGNETRVFLCENHSGDEVANDVGILLDDGDDGNMYLSQRAYKCRSCTHGQCKKQGCKKQSKVGGFCVSHGGKTKKPECKKQGCTKYARAGGFCVLHGGKRKKQVCKHPAGCTKHARGG